MNNINYKTWIHSNTRPDTSNLSDKELKQIIILIKPDWFGDNQNKSRLELIEKVFELWSNMELTDSNDNTIECLICYDNLTQGNNLTLCCGHKFHSNCLIKNVVFRTAYKYDICLTDPDNNSNKIVIECVCPQCNTTIDEYNFFKPNLPIEKDNEEI
jgi:hypothetical protein